MPKICSIDSCNFNQFGGGYCKIHQSHRTDKKPAKLKQQTTKIRHYNKKRAKVQKNEYVPKMLEYLKNNEFCVIKSPVCGYFATCVNHIKGRHSVERLLDETYWEASCHSCNMYIEQNPNFNNGKHKQKG